MKKNKKKSIVILTIFSILLVLGIVFAFVSLNKGELGKYDYTPYPKSIKLGLDLKGGVYAVYNVQKPSNMTEAEFKDRIKGTVYSFQDILFSKGYSEAIVVQSNVTNKSADIRVEVPNVDNPKKIFDLIGKPATVSFTTDKEGKNIVVKGSDVKQAQVVIDNDGKNQISLKFNKEGSDDFAEVTKKLAAQKQPLYIFVDGKLLMSPTVNEPILNGQAIISQANGYSREEAERLAIRIQSGSLPLKLTLAENDTISPTLGTDALQHGLVAGAVALALIFILLLVLYRALGFAACLSLVYFTITYLFLLAIFPWVQLTLAGIAGILLSIGMAVDANIIIFERIKEEYKGSNGNKSIKTCVKNGFKRSATAIIDGNVTTIMGAIVLLIFGVASIKGFAITLLIGIFTSLFTSLFLTRILIYCFLAFADKNKKLYALSVKKSKYLVSNKDGTHVETEATFFNTDILDNKDEDKIKDDREYDEEYGIENQSDKKLNLNNKKIEKKENKEKNTKIKNKPKKEERFNYVKNYKKLKKESTQYKNKKDEINIYEIEKEVNDNA